jgi:hypothetical protein
VSIVGLERRLLCICKKEDRNPTQCAGFRRLTKLPAAPHVGLHKKGGQQMDKWIAIAAAIPASGVFAWIVVRFIEWRRKFLASLWQQLEEKG